MPGETVSGLEVAADVLREGGILRFGVRDEAGEGVFQTQPGLFEGGVVVLDAAAGFGVAADLRLEEGEFPIDLRKIRLRLALEELRALFFQLVHATVVFAQGAGVAIGLAGEGGIEQGEDDPGIHAAEVHPEAELDGVEDLPGLGGQDDQGPSAGGEFGAAFGEESA